MKNFMVKQLMEHYRVCAIGFDFIYNRFLNRTWYRFRDDALGSAQLTAMNSAGRSVTDESQFQINEFPVSITSSSLSGLVETVTVQNQALFRDSTVFIRDFRPVVQDLLFQFYLHGNDFVDALKVDRYGFVFVDLMIHRENQFLDKHKVFGHHGFVSRITNDKICYKDLNIYSEEPQMSSFKWYNLDEDESEHELMYFFAAFEEQMKTFVFTAVEGQRNDGQLSSDTETHKFQFDSFSELAVPFRSLAGHQSVLSNIGPVHIYAKPDDDEFQWTHIKTISRQHQQTILIDEIAPESGVELNAAVDSMMKALVKRETEIVDGKAFLRTFNLFPERLEEWLPLVLDHEDVQKGTAYHKREAIRRVVIELAICPKQIANWFIDRNGNDKNVDLRHLVGEFKLYPLLDHYRVLTSKFKVKNHSQLFKCSWLQLDKNTEFDFDFGVEKHEDSCFRETEYWLNDRQFTFANSSVNATAGSLTLRNATLFGNRKINLQTLPGIEKQRDVRKLDFVAHLSCDDSGTISPQIIIGQQLLVNLNGQWIDVFVSRATTVYVCVKWTDGDLVRMQWVDRKDLDVQFQFENGNEISDYVVAASVGTIDAANLTPNAREFAFDNTDDVSISTKSLQVTRVDADHVHLYIKPKGIRNDECNFHRFKSVLIPADSRRFNKYHLRDRQPLHIDQMIQVGELFNDLGEGGEFKVVSKSQIIIGKSGIINASRCTFAEQYYPWCGTGRGFITLIAEEDVVNEGKLLCRASNHGFYRGGSVLIVTNGVFRNKGIIDCGDDGIVRIKCARFINDGQITPSAKVTEEANTLSSGMGNTDLWNAFANDVEWLKQNGGIRSPLESYAEPIAGKPGRRGRRRNVRRRLIKQKQFHQNLLVEGAILVSAASASDVCKMIIATVTAAGTDPMISDSNPYN